MAHLIIQQDGKTSWVELNEPVTTIGRHPSSTVQLVDTKASRHHCRIEQFDRGYKLVDLESANGTQVNGSNVDHKVLEPGDRIEIGTSVLKFELERKDVLRTRRLARRSRSARRRHRSEPPGADVATDDVNEETMRLPIANVGDGSLIDGSAETGEHTPPGGGGAKTAVDELLPGSPELMNRADLAVVLRKLFNTLIEQHGEEGLYEIERLFEDYMDEGVLEPRVRHLIEDRDMMAALLELNTALNAGLTLDALLDRILDETIDFTDAERGFLILLEPGDPEAEPRVERARNFDGEALANADAKFSRGIVSEVLASGKPLLSTNAREEARFLDSDSVLDQRLLSVLCVPMRRGEEVIGALYIDNRFETGVFQDRDLLWLDTIGDLAAIAIDNARQLQRLDDAMAELDSAHRRIHELNTLLEQKLEAREIELAAMKAKIAEGGATPRTDVDGYVPQYDYKEMIGRSAAMRRVFELLDKATGSDMPVLIGGENGTGKDLAARALHRNGPRASKPYVAENCAAVPPTLFESIFFGHEKGAFTGADRAKAGLFEQADGGTLFLDEVGELPLDIQARFLRVLNDQEVRRLGSNRTRRVDVRIVAATNRDLEQMVAEKRFREDLFYRLAVVRVRMPALRERPDDVPELVEAFFAHAWQRAGVEPKPIDPQVHELFRRAWWPGNVRELRNMVDRIATLHLDRPAVTPDCVPEDMGGKRDRDDSGDATTGLRIPPIETGTPLKEAVRIATEAIETDIISRVWRECGWTKIETAERLGISRPTLDAKIDAYDLKKLKDEDAGSPAG